MLTIKKIIFLNFVFLFLFPSLIYAAPSITISLPQTSVTAGDEFMIEISAEDIDPNTAYYMKALGGPELYDVQTLHNSSWLSWNSTWSDFPTLTSENSSASATLTARFKPGLQGATLDIKTRIRKADSETNIDSNIMSMQVIIRPTPQPTPTSTKTPTPTPTHTPSPTPTKPPTPKPTPKKTSTPSPTPEDQPAEGDVLSIVAQATPELWPTSTPLVATDQQGKPVALAAFLFIVPGVGLTIFGIYSFLKRSKTQYNDMSENSILRPKI